VLNQRRPPGRTHHASVRGYTLVELVIAVIIVGVLLSLGLSSFIETIHNARLRARAENILGGLQLAKLEALKRNATVRFQLTDTLDASCTLLNSGPNWVVSIGSAAGICNTAADPTGNLILAKSDAVSDTHIVLTAIDSGGTAASTFCFNSLGQLTTAGGCVGATNLRTDINFVWDDQTTCRATPGSDGVACLRVTVSPGGLVRLCDPSIPLANVTDSRRCS